MIQEGHLEVVEFLFKSGAKVDPAGFYGMTPLWAASYVCFCFGFSYFKLNLLMFDTARSFESRRISVRERRES